MIKTKKMISRINPKNNPGIREIGLTKKESIF